MLLICIESLVRRGLVDADGRIVAEGTLGELTARLADPVWSQVVPRGETLPEAVQQQVVHLSALPNGTLAVVQAAKAPSENGGSSRAVTDSSPSLPTARSSG